ncbi:hypothetical protein ACFL6M_05380 [Candidatus Eisenbacteria bacterium]|uniref:Uncharacterized protein n=1 Tax=Eiseniibacteriota bacterium TaxID=2212470 RepID=A0ABV6YL18_UNCEI
MWIEVLPKELGILRPHLQIQFHEFVEGFAKLADGVRFPYLTGAADEKHLSGRRHLPGPEFLIN